MGIVFGYVALVVSGFTALYAPPSAMVMGKRFGSEEVSLRRASAMAFLPAIFVPLIIFVVVAAFLIDEMGTGTVTLKGIIGVAAFMEMISIVLLIPVTAVVFGISLIVGRRGLNKGQRGRA